MGRYSQFLALGRRSKHLAFSSNKTSLTETSPNGLLSHMPPISPTTKPSNSSTTTPASSYHGYQFIRHFSSLSAASRISPEVLHHQYFPEPQTTSYTMTVKSSEVVKAAVAAAQPHWLPMSNLDLLLPPLDVGVLFCYKNKGGNAMAADEVAYIVKRSLSQVLAVYYPLAGELVHNGHGEPEILCNNNGVDFVRAYADVDLKELDLHRPDDSIKGKLVPDKKRGVLSVQVTEMKCGGIVVGITFDHRVADGYSANMFLSSWVETAQSKPLSLVPSFRRSVLNPRRPTQYNPTIDNLFVPVTSLPPPRPPSDHNQLMSRIYSIRSEHIGHLQSLATSNHDMRTTSKLRSFTAFLWKLVAEGGAEDDVPKSCKMGLVVDGRKGLSNGDKPAMQSYFGNVLSIPYGEADMSELKEMPLDQVADKVHGFLDDSMKDEHFKGLIDWVELHRPVPAVAKIYVQSQESSSDDGEAVVVSSGQTFRLGDMDFGWGKPEFGSFHFAWGGETGYVMPMPSSSRSGDWIVYMHLMQRHFDVIDAKAPHIFKPLTTSYLKL